MVFIIGFIGRVEFDVESPEGPSELGMQGIRKLERHLAIGDVPTIKKAPVEI